MLGVPDRRPRCHDRPRTHLLVLLSDDGRPFFARRDACGRHFVHGTGGAFVFPARLAPQERHVPAAGLPAFLGGGNLASGQAADDGGTAVSAAGRHSGGRAAASCGGYPVAQARGEGFACSGAGAQPRVFRLRAISVSAGCAGPFPPAAGRACSAVAGRQRTRDSSSGLVGRLLCGGAAESAGVSPQAAADVDRIRLRVFFFSFCWA